MTISELKNQFKKISNSEDLSEQDDFCEQLCERHDKEYLEYHYWLINGSEPMCDSLFQRLCREFREHREAGEKFLLKKNQARKRSFNKSKSIANIRKL